MSSLPSFLYILFKGLLWLLFMVYIVAPGILYLFPSIARKFVFFYLYACPLYSNLTDLPRFGRHPNNTRNFYITSLPESNVNIKLGLWHVLPNIDQANSDVIPDVSYYESKLANGRPIILYFHGNALHRGGGHMNGIYRVFSSLNYHTVALDYRGYGDSEGDPTCEEDLILDALAGYLYVKQKAPKSPLFIWGHSLGTGVTGGLMRHLRSQERFASLLPDGIVLESAFTKIREAGQHHPLARFHRWMPYFETVFLDSIAKNNIFFDNEANFAGIPTPLMMLHARDDHVIPYDMGHKLFEHLFSVNKFVRFHGFNAGRGYYHKYLYKSTDIPIVLKNFVTDVLKQKAV